MIKAGGRRGFRNQASRGVHSFNPQSGAHAGKMPLERLQRFREAIGPTARHRLEPFGLRPQPKTTVRNRAVAPQTVRHEAVRRVNAIALGELKKGSSRELQFRSRRRAHRGSSRFIAVKQPYPFVVMTRLGHEPPGLAAGRQRLIEAFRQCAFLGLEEARDKESSKSAGTVEKALPTERVVRREQSLEEVHMGILPTHPLPTLSLRPP